MEISLPEGLNAERRATLALALSQLGTAEDPPRSNRGPVERYIPRWARARGPAWCCFFVTWTLRETIGEHVPWLGSVRRFVNLCERNGRIVPRPQPGDIFAWVRADGTGHIGFVLRVDDGGINTVEGNSGDRVRAATRPVDGMTFIDPYAERVCLNYERGLLDLPEAPAATR